MGDDDERFMAIQGELDRTKHVMRDNIDRTIARGEKLEHLEDRADNINNRAQTFHHGARQARKQFCYEKWRNILAVVFAVGILILIIYFLAK